jgi:hypothetical protein
MVLLNLGQNRVNVNEGLPKLSNSQFKKITPQTDRNVYEKTDNCQNKPGKL